MKKLIYKDENLLLAKDIDVVLHQANCQNIFGSGIARTIREMYPSAYAADTAATKSTRNTLGNYSVAHIAREDRHDTSIQYIFNLYGQSLGTDHNKLYDRKTDYEALYSAMEKVAYALKLVGNLRIGIPYKMGSGLGGGNFDIVERLIEVAFKDYAGDVYIYKFTP